jgi:hypothetical protein
MDSSRSGFSLLHSFTSAHLVEGYPGVFFLFFLYSFALDRMVGTGLGSTLLLRGANDD